MTKTYLGNDTYEVHLESGKTLVLTGDEMDEIAKESPVVELAKKENEDYKVLYDQAERIAESLHGDLDELESNLMSKDLDTYQAVRGDLIELRKKVREI